MKQPFYRCCARSLRDASFPRVALTVACLVLLMGLGCSREAKRQAAPEIESSRATASHQQMVDTLARVARDATRTNEYFNSESLIEASRIELADAIARDDVVGELESHKAVGIHELNIGNSAAAAEHFATSCDLMKTVEDRKLASISAAAKERLLLQAGVAYLRLAEDENCVNCVGGGACILPIAKEAVHQKRTGSENAMKFFKRALEVNPRNATAAWLLNVAAMTLGEYPGGVPEEYRIPEEKFASSVSFPRFKNIATELGLDTLSHAGGAIADDFDGDQLLDLIVSNWDPAGQIQFFHNNGDGSFTNATEKANLIGITGGLNTVHADYDNDGDLDVYVLRGAWLPAESGRYPNSLLQNDGQGRFTDVTFAVGLGESPAPTQTAAWADFDNDGDLDLFVGNEDARCQLFRNQNGRFEEIAEEAGVANSRGVAKAVAWGDYDGDRWPDLYVSNLNQANLMFHNNHDGTFTEVARDLDVANPTQSFACWFWDYNNDGKLDLFVASYQVGVEFVGLEFLGAGNLSEPDCLYENMGDGRFREVAAERGLNRVTQPMGCNYGDLDNDGYLDFYLGTGYPGYDALMPNVMYHNRGGEGFEDVTIAGGFGHLQKGHAVAFADFDHDGDQDIFTELGGAYRGDAFHDALFMNPGFENSWLKVRLVGTQSNRSAIGARIKVSFEEKGKTRDVYRWVSAGSSFGGNPLRQEIGLGKASTIESLEIYWPTSDTTQVFENVEINQLIEITEGANKVRSIPLKSAEFDAS